MKTKRKQILAMALSAPIILAALAGCAQTGTGNQSTPESSSQSGSSSASMPVNSTDSFYGLCNDVTATIYEAGDGAALESSNFSGSADLNADGKNESISLDFTSNYSSDSKSVLKIGGNSVSFFLFDVRGIYVLKLDNSAKMLHLAVVDLGPSDYYSTYFFGYDGTSLYQLGSVGGKVQPDTKSVPYNYAILTNGKGLIIPSLGMIEFISPNIIVNEKKYSDNKISDTQVDLSAALGKQYTVNFGTTAFFEAANPVPSDFNPTYETQNQLGLEQGQMITVNKINGFRWIDATLPDGRRGALYYYLVS